MHVGLKYRPGVAFATHTFQTFIYVSSPTLGLSTFNFKDSPPEIDLSVDDYPFLVV